MINHQNEIIPWSNLDLDDLPSDNMALEYEYVGMGQNPIPLVNIKRAGKWMFIPLKMVCIGIDP
jgi:hypothetical protein